MVADRSFQNYINFLLQAGSTAEEVVDVPKDYPDYIRVGNEYADLVSRPGWNRLLDAMEVRANTCLAAIRGCVATDPLVTQGLVRQWREAEESLKFIQVTVAEGIERRKQILEELQQRFLGLDNSNPAQDQAIADYMNLTYDEVVNQQQGEDNE